MLGLSDNGCEESDRAETTQKKAMFAGKQQKRNRESEKMEVGLPDPRVVFMSCAAQWLQSGM